MDADTIPGQLDAINRQLSHHDVRMSELERAMKENTLLTRFTGKAVRETADRVDETAAKVDTAVQQLTDAAETLQDIKHAQVAGRVATRAVKWVGGLAMAGSAVYALIYQATHGGKLPGQ